ncbi:MAG: diguanylate cyclase [Pseudomonadales bacterium]|nr:diguanylate cyclase [Pseudomonadales bacterium]MBO6564357.1 diguanylate cyclase [Pseudomonadales bacterium]MBO6595440.1 diguanylate cyclase [Pseudomonadales bacterium]MBO6657557.1 diguanylate cyclase [Pseudomonadales bacterium]MBO6701940.1 diguanylate cyclase [Pseudomonadales bacterium]
MTDVNIAGSAVTEVDMEESGIDLQHQMLVESLMFLYRSMPTSALGHVLAGVFVAYALWDVIDSITLLSWLGVLAVVAGFRLFSTMWVERRLHEATVVQIEQWATFLLFCAFLQTATWGASVFLIWPQDLAHRAVLVVILAGVIATGGIILALHRRSFAIYCLPIAIPAVTQLFMSGGKLEIILGVLIVFYSGILFASVNRLTSMFREGLRVRLLTQTESRTDAMTALSNRRGFDESLHDIWQQAIRTNQSIGLLIIDVDHFKMYNDYYGHPQGDIALRKVGELLSKIASRSTDLCARIGGEEFAVLMPATDLEGSRQVAEAIQTELTKARIPHRNSERGFLTVSVGLNVTTPARQSSADLFMMETDQALYEAKESGRNQISLARSVTAPLS